MGKVTGFLSWPRQLAPTRDIGERVGDFREFVGSRDPKLSSEQGGRCMDCGTPFCQAGCPLGNLIPDWNELIYRNRWHEAYERLAATNDFPEFTGRVCPAPCEHACVLAINDQPITIEQNEKEIAERAFAEGWIVARRVRRKSGRKVAIVGSGPAGLAAASQLIAAGHDVSVFEADQAAGGLLRFGIPDFKLEKSVVQRRLRLMEREGVAFRCGVRVGVDVSWGQLRDEFDALLIAIGAQKPRELQIPGRELDGVVLAMDYLTQQNRRVAGLPLQGAELLATDKDVIILGGGDTGSDCLGTALRQGAKRVTQIEILPEPPLQRAADNPWPQWARVLQTSSSQKEGGERRFALRTERLSGDQQGRLQKLHAVRVELRDGQLVAVPDGELSLSVELLILAMGFVSPFTDTLTAELDLMLDGRGNVKVDERFQTNLAGVFAAGDAQRGQSLVVWAIADGRRAAQSIDRFLAGR
ncbi:MAG: glutamate synthase subunit beta [Deltaproteobacteria bacterium]|nr:glutamate synthase subunit beta [Deltaproteobacteria bacterium]